MVLSHGGWAHSPWGGGGVSHWSVRALEPRPAPRRGLNERERRVGEWVLGGRTGPSPATTEVTAMMVHVDRGRPLRGVQQRGSVREEGEVYRRFPH